MTTKKARKVLKDELENISDNNLQRNIEVADLLKNIFLIFKEKRINKQPIVELLGTRHFLFEV
jgi:hypothetical protein